MFGGATKPASGGGMFSLTPAKDAPKPEGGLFGSGAGAPAGGGGMFGGATKLAQPKLSSYQAY